jgi:L-ribulose-5-phosphate 3-epimerase
MLRQDAPTCVARLADMGFTDFEIMMHPGHLWPAETDAGARRTLRSRLRSRGLRLVTINMPNVDLNVAGTTPEMRAYSLGIIEGFVQLAGDLGAEGVVIGPGKPNPLMPAPKDQLLGYYLAALDRLAPLAAHAGTALWLENMPFAFLPDAPSLMTAIESFGDPAIGVVYDLANAHFISEDPASGLARRGDRLRLIHVSDTGRDVYRHAPIGTGTVPVADLPQLLAATCAKTPVMLEIVSSDPDRDIPASRARLEALDWSRSVAA